MKLLYVEFKAFRAFRPVPPEDPKGYGHNINLGDAKNGPVLYAHAGTGPQYGWDLQRAGTSLVMSKGGITYECPWDDVKMALQEPAEAAKPAAVKQAKAAQ